MNSAEIIRLLQRCNRTNRQLSQSEADRIRDRARQVADLDDLITIEQLLRINQI